VGSLRSRLFLSHLSVLGAATLIVGFSLLTLVQTYFLQAMEDSLLAQASLIAESVLPGVTLPSGSSAQAPAYNAVQQQSTGSLSVQIRNVEPEPGDFPAPDLAESNLAYLSQFTLDVSATLRSHIRVVDAEGMVLVDTNEESLGRNISEDEDVRAALSGDRSSRSIDAEGGPWYYVAVPLLMRGDVVGAISLGQPMGDVARVLADLRLRLLLSALLAVLISTPLALGLTRTISRPVVQLTDAAAHLTLGDFDYPLEASGPTELRELGRSFLTMRQRLASMERTRNQFVSDVSHELRTPLTAIKGLTETLRDGAVDDPSVRDHFLASMEQETDRLTRLVQDLLELSRADSHALHLRTESFALEPVLRNAVARLQPSTEELGLKVLLNAPVSPLHIRGDRDRLDQIILILLDNAIKHTARGGTIVVSCSPQASAGGHVGPWAVVEVSDDGEGIAAEDLPHVFERFYRGDPSRSRDRGGSGLGLSIARALVEAQGGHVWITSPAPGSTQGTVASFCLPLVS
jgi:signal transduction histidine kinase